MVNKKPVPIITIDGPSGSGKGTLAFLLAQTLHWRLLDSGALYRLTALAATQRGLAMTNTSALVHLASHLEVQFKPDAGITPDMTIVLEGQPVGMALRTEAIGAKASQVAAIPAVRAALLQRQRDFAKAPGLVADGRDMGTVVFPNARVKFYLTASAEERAKRRLEQLQQQGISGSFRALLADIETRDKRDSHRSIAPLQPAVDAVVIDSTALNIQDVLNRMMAELNRQALTE